MLNFNSYIDKERSGDVPRASLKFENGVVDPRAFLKFENGVDVPRAFQNQNLPLQRFTFPSDNLSWRGYPLSVLNQYDRHN